MFPVGNYLADLLCDVGNLPPVQMACQVNGGLARLQYDQSAHGLDLEDEILVEGDAESHLRVAFPGETEASEADQVQKQVSEEVPGIDMDRKTQKARHRTQADC